MKTQLKRSVHAYYESRMRDSFSQAEVFDALLGASGNLAAIQSLASELYQEKASLLTEVDSLDSVGLAMLGSLPLQDMQDDEVLIALEDLFSLSEDRQKQAMLTAIRNTFVS